MSPLNSGAVQLFSLFLLATSIMQRSVFF